MNRNDKEVIGYLVFNRVKINNANSISSPLTYGFPAITGFLGAVHAMSRKLSQHDTLNHLSLDGVLIACHDCQPQTYRANNYNDYTFNQTRNPIKKDGKTASIIEEGKCNLDITLAVEVLAEDALDVEDNHISQLIEQSKQWIMQQRIAGGSVTHISRYQSVRFVTEEDSDEIKPMLLPAFVLMNAQQDLIDIKNILQATNPKVTELDALLDVCSLHHVPETDDKNKTTWHTRSAKTGRGWLVPMPIGYQGISDLFEPGEMQNTRNPEYPSQYVEAIYSLGKWVFPHRINELQNAFWHYQYDFNNELYLVTQTN